MRRTLTKALILLNILLAASFLAKPLISQIIPLGLFDCCKADMGDEGYCCYSCCWFFPSCSSHSDCVLEPGR